ncbi:MAG: hypothetical protein O3A01_08295 [bacterium]|nr:hypothetical protein [bacterium]
MQLFPPKERSLYQCLDGTRQRLDEAIAFLNQNAPFNMLKEAVDTAISTTTVLHDLAPGLHIHLRAFIMRCFLPQADVVSYDSYSAKLTQYIPAKLVQAISLKVHDSLPSAFNNQLELLFGLVNIFKSDQTLASKDALDKFIHSLVPHNSSSYGFEPPNCNDYLDLAEIPPVFNELKYLEDLHSYFSSQPVMEVESDTDSVPKFRSAIDYDQLTFAPSLTFDIARQLQSEDPETQLIAIQTLMLMHHDQAEGSPALFMQTLHMLIANSEGEIPLGNHTQAILTQLAAIRATLSTDTLKSLFDTHVVDKFTLYSHPEHVDCPHRMPLFLAQIRTGKCPTDRSMQREYLLEMVNSRAPLFLFANEPNPNPPFTPPIVLTLSQLLNYPEYTELLDYYGASISVNIQSQSGVNLSPEYLSMVDLLNERRQITPKQADSLRLTFVTTSAYQGNLHHLRHIINTPTLWHYLSMPTDSGLTPFHIALQYGQTNWVKTLLTATQNSPNLAKSLFPTTTPDPLILNLALGSRDSELIRLLMDYSKKFKSICTPASGNLAEFEDVNHGLNDASLLLLLEDYATAPSPRPPMPTYKLPGRNGRQIELGILSYYTIHRPHLFEPFLAFAKRHPDIAKELLTEQDFTMAVSWCCANNDTQRLEIILNAKQELPHMQRFRATDRVYPATEAIKYGDGQTLDWILARAETHPEDAHLLLTSTGRSASQLPGNTQTLLHDVIIASRPDLLQKLESLSHRSPAIQRLLFPPNYGSLY